MLLARAACSPETAYNTTPGILVCCVSPSQGSATLEVPAAPGAAAGCQAALHLIHEGTLGGCWDRRKRLCDDMYRGV